jgi:hypothetical protein
MKYMSLFQNPVGAKLQFDETSSWKNRLSPKLSQSGFSTKFKKSIPKAEVLEQPRLIELFPKLG